MKPTLLFATLSMVFASPTLSAKSELEALRARCAEQERQIQQLEQDNAKLRSGSGTSRPNELASAKLSAPAEVAKSIEPPKAATQDSSVYVVKKGDSIEKIARKTGSTPGNIGKLNGLKSSSIIHPGQTLKIPGGSAVAVTKPIEPSLATRSQTPPANNGAGRTYQIKDNDTFSSISRKEGIPVSKLIAANPKVKPTALRTGQIINLGTPKSAPTVASQVVAKSPQPPSAPLTHPTAPSKPAATPVLAEKSAPQATTPPPVSQATAATAPVAPTTPAAPPTAVVKNEPAPAPAPTPAPETSSPTPEKKIRPITIDGEMTYGEFAAKHGTNPERLNALNGLDLNNTTVLAKGSELYVPAQP